MKKILLVFAALLAANTITAQEADHTFEFVDEAGNIVPDGTVITVNTVEDNGLELLLPVPLAVKATGETDKGGTIRVDASGMPNGNFQICSFGNCISSSTPCIFNSAKGKLNPATQKSIAAEWIPTAEGAWKVTLQLQVVEPEYDDMSEEYIYDKVIADGPKVTVLFEYGASAGIDSHSSTLPSSPMAYYNLSGQKVSGPQKGVNIVRYQDGSCKKVSSPDFP